MDELLKKVLGHTYGGPSISYENDRFVLYGWGDAPVNMDVLLSAKTWDEFVEKLEIYAEDLE